MPTSLTRSREQFIELILRFLWRQWSALGVAGHATSSDPWMIDPEALLLISTTFARHDPRLFDEIFDWLKQNGPWINLQRLARLQKDHGIGERTVLAALAQHLAKDSTHFKWKILTWRAAQGPAKNGPEPLFPGIPLLGPPDEIFLRWGWLRAPATLRGMSQVPRPDQPATFLIKLRALFGRMARAEVLGWLLTHDAGHAAEIASSVGYFPRSIQLVLNDLLVSGHVHAVRVGREKQFSIRHNEWKFLITWSDGAQFPRWVDWAPVFSALSIFFDALAQPGLDEHSDRFQAIQFREALDKATPALAQAGLPHQLNATRDLRGTELVSAFIDDLSTLLG